MLQWNCDKNYTFTDTHIYFWGSVFSQWHKCKFTDKSLGLTFNSAEQYMMWYKAFTFNDLETAGKILKECDPKEQKALGRLVKGYDDAIWNFGKLNVVSNGNYLKFSQSESLKKELLDTGDKVLVEGSPYDRIWGVGLTFDDERIIDESNWRGENLLGKALMVARDRIRSPL